MTEASAGEAELKRRHKDNLEKVRLGRSCAATSVNLKWIAQHMRMGSWRHVSNLLAQEEAKKCKEPGPTPILFLAKAE